jgi:hypothetical protein
LSIDESGIDGKADHVGNAFPENIFDTLSCFPGVDESAE